MSTTQYYISQLYYGFVSMYRGCTFYAMSFTFLQFHPPTYSTQFTNPIHSKTIGLVLGLYWVYEHFKGFTGVSDNIMSIVHVLAVVALNYGFVIVQVCVTHRGKCT